MPSANATAIITDVIEAVDKFTESEPPDGRPDLDRGQGDLSAFLQEAGDPTP